MALIPTARTFAQSFKTLHSFTGSAGNIDGFWPRAGLVSSGNTLYGATTTGGAWNHGTVFAVNADGTCFTILHAFEAYTNPNGFNNEGVEPWASLVLESNTLYGTTQKGGINGSGTVFKMNTDGTGFTALHHFSGLSTDGRPPVGRLVASGNVLYGATKSGGQYGYGAVFAINIDGTGFTNLYSFSPPPLPIVNYARNPMAGLLLSDNILYGVSGLTADNTYPGTVFRLNTDGTGFTKLHDFVGSSDGAYPEAELVLAGDTLYGTAGHGGASLKGTIFKVKTNGTAFMTLHHFTDNGHYPYTNGDGAFPSSALIVSGDMLYGTTTAGGTSDYGTVFAIKTDGTSFTTVHNFAGGPTDGGTPYPGVILSGNTLYGTTYWGGARDNGLVFSISFSPELKIIRSGDNVVLSWPTNVASFSYSGYTLQSAMDLVAPAAWTNVSTAPVVVNGQNTVTNPTSGAQRFYRLSQ